MHLLVSSIQYVDNGNDDDSKLCALRAQTEFRFHVSCKCSRFVWCSSKSLKSNARMNGENWFEKTIYFIHVNKVQWLLNFKHTFHPIWLHSQNKREEKRWPQSMIQKRAHSKPIKTFCFDLWNRNLIKPNKHVKTQCDIWILIYNVHMDICILPIVLLSLSERTSWKEKKIFF